MIIVAVNVVVQLLWKESAHVTVMPSDDAAATLANPSPSVRWDRRNRIACYAACLELVHGRTVAIGCTCRLPLKPTRKLVSCNSQSRQNNSSIECPIGMLTRPDTLQAAALGYWPMPPAAPKSCPTIPVTCIGTYFCCCLSTSKPSIGVVLVQWICERQQWRTTKHDQAYLPVFACTPIQASRLPHIQFPILVPVQTSNACRSATAMHLGEYTWSVVSQVQA